MKLLLVQHGAAVPRDTDPARPLSATGRRDVERLAAFLDRAGIKVARMAHSGKARAAQTADILAGRLLTAGAPEPYDGLNPDDPVMPFAELVAAWDEDGLVVGHQPFLEKAVCLLLTGDEGHAAVDFRPGSLVCLEREADGPWALAWMLRPEIISA
jgi:phosphohistidine phosphatase